MWAEIPSWPADGLPRERIVAAVEVSSMNSNSNGAEPVLVMYFVTFVLSNPLSG